MGCNNFSLLTPHTESFGEKVSMVLLSPLLIYLKNNVYVLRKDSFMNEILRFSSKRGKMTVFSWYFKGDLEVNVFGCVILFLLLERHSKDLCSVNRANGL